MRDFLSHTPTCSHARTHAHEHMVTYPLSNINLEIAYLDKMADENLGRNIELFDNSSGTRNVGRRKIRWKDQGHALTE